MPNVLTKYKTLYILFAVVIAVLLSAYKFPSFAGTSPSQTPHGGPYSVSAGLDGGAYIINTETGQLWFRKGFVFQYYGTPTEPTFEILTVTELQLKEEK